jgi:hypothetical protein
VPARSIDNQAELMRHRARELLAGNQEPIARHVQPIERHSEQFAFQ